MLHDVGASQSVDLESETLTILELFVIYCSEVGGVVPKHEAPYREFNVAAAVRDVSCVTCRACDVARDRSIGRESGE